MPPLMEDFTLSLYSDPKVPGQASLL